MSTTQPEWDKQTQVEQATRVIQYLNKKAGTKFAALNPKQKPTANCKMIVDRIKEGYGKDDFIKVVDNQSREWGGDEKMEKYLRPSTLFRKANFENYVAAGDPTSTEAVIRRNLAQQPDPRAALKDFLRTWQDRGNSWGYEMPETPQAAADWWITTMQEPCSNTEKMFKATKKNAKTSGDYTWQYPYLDRLLMTIRKYLCMSREDQVIIYGCVDEGVSWRGDDIEFFYTHQHSVYNETMKMREDPDAFKLKAKTMYGILESNYANSSN